MRVVITDNSIVLKPGEEKEVEFHGNLPVSGCFWIRFIEHKMTVDWGYVIPHGILNNYVLIQISMSKKVYDNIGDCVGCPFPNVVITVLDEKCKIYKIIDHNEIGRFLISNRADKNNMINKIICWMADKQAYWYLFDNPRFVRCLNFRHVKIYGMYEAFINHWGCIPDAYLTKLITDVRLMTKVLPKLIKYNEFIALLSIKQRDMTSLTVLDQMIIIHRNKKIARILLDETDIRINYLSARYYHIPEVRAFLEDVLLKRKFSELFY